MVLATKHIGSNSSKNFISQQKLIGKQEGYIEEMMNGLKVVKSFCHEEESKADFDKINIIKEITGVTEEIAYEKFAKYKTVKNSLFSIMSGIDDENKVNEIMEKNKQNLRKALENING